MLAVLELPGRLICVGQDKQVLCLKRVELTYLACLWKCYAEGLRKGLSFMRIAQNLCAHNKHRFYNSHCNRAHCTSHDSIKKRALKTVLICL